MTKQEFIKVMESVIEAIGANDEAFSCCAIREEFERNVVFRKYVSIFKDTMSCSTLWLHDQLPQRSDEEYKAYRLTMLELFKNYAISEELYKEF